MPDSQNFHIVVIGAGSDIAKACIQRITELSVLPITLSIVTRSGSVDDFYKKFRLINYNALHSFSCDFCEPESIKSVSIEICKYSKPDLVLIAHGKMGDQEEFQKNISLVNANLLENGVSPCLFAEAFCELMQDGKDRVIGVIGSVAGDRGRRKNYVYGAGKALVDCYLQGMQHRLSAGDSKLKICRIKPGPVQTKMTSSIPSHATMPLAKDVAAVIVPRLLAGQEVIYAPLKFKIIMPIIKMIPLFIFRKINL